MIEIYKHQFQDLSQVISLIKNRNYRFIIYMDDLSFEEFEIEYKYLKAVIEGGLEIRPDNVLIYATSNRRHLIKETWNDRNDMENNNGIHRSDTIQEKLSLVNRFGVTISYSAPSQKEYFEIVKGLAEKEHITMDEKELCAEANKWELAHGGISGRTAQQFINYLKGRGCKKMAYLAAIKQPDTLFLCDYLVADIITGMISRYTVSVASSCLAEHRNNTVPSSLSIAAGLELPGSEVYSVFPA